MQAYRRPMSTRVRREATHIFPRAIVGSTPFLATVEAGLERLADKPVLLCWGDKDIAFRENKRSRFARTFPRARRLALPGAGHSVQEESPAEIAAAIRAWWPADVEGEK
jgi:haloalkane dehalogenase